MKKFLFSIIMLVIAMVAKADKEGTWKLYPSYTNVQEVQETSTDIYVLANNNLFSYHKSDESLTEYIEEGAESATGHSIDCLSSSNILHIAWVPAAKKLVIAYSDGMIDILDANGNTGHISALKNTTQNNNKTIDAIYVNGKYAFLHTEETDTAYFNVIKIDVANEYVSKTYLAKETVPDMPSQPVTPTSKETPQYKYAKPDGPKFQDHNYVKFSGGKLYSVRGVYEDWRDIETEKEGVLQIYDSKSCAWTIADNSYATNNSKNCIDFLSVDIDPTKANHAFVSARSGLFEYQDGKMVSYVDCNSGTPIAGLGPDWTVVMDAKFDTSGNLWVFNMINFSNIICYTADHSWKAFDHTSSIPLYPRFRKAFTDSRGYMWLANDYWKPSSYGFYVPSTDKMYYSTNFENQDGALITPYELITKGVAEDADNNIWYCTDYGIFYITPATISKMLQGVSNENIKVVQPKINRNDGTGLADYLLNGVGAYDIIIDAANRKWFATLEDGLYCISSDNQSQIYHFTTENSPLPNNCIKSISLDKDNGVLYIGTLDGLCSFQTDVVSTYGDFTSGNVYAYPNPVTPDYTGDITIRGLTNGSSVKITTPSGRVVNTGLCNGGSYAWDGCDGNGKHVASGVYMVLVSDAAGDNGCVTKIAIIK